MSRLTTHEDQLTNVRGTRISENAGCEARADVISTEGHKT